MLRLCGLLATAGFCASVTAATEVDVLRSEIELLQTKMSILENEVSELREITGPLRFQRRVEAAQRHKDVCAYLRREIKAGRLTQQDAAALDCK